MRPKYWRFSQTNGQTTTIYWPTDTYISTQEYAFNFRKTAGSGSYASGCSASYTIDRVLADGVVSAHWVQVREFASGTAFNYAGPVSCWRFTVTSSGATTDEIMALQPGPERVF